MTGRALILSTFAVLAGGLPAHAVDFEKFKSTEYEVVEQSMTALLDDGGASAWNGLLAARLVTSDSATLRATLQRVVSILRPGAMPRVWFT